MRKYDIIRLKQISLIFLVFFTTLLAGFVLTGHGEQIKKIISLILIILISFFGALNLIDTGQEQSVIAVDIQSDIVTVTRVIDGDTIEIDHSAKVRLLGIDAPEYGECYYEESKTALQALIQEEYVRLEKDIEAADSFGRLLRYVVLQEQGPFENNLLVNDYMIRNGFAKVKIISPNKRYSDTFNGSQQQAKETGKGLWTACADELAELNTGDLPTDPDCYIKGNISLKAYGKTYFTIDCYNYSQVKINLSKGEKYFCTEQEALDAGFRKSDTCP